MPIGRQQRTFWRGSYRGISRHTHPMCIKYLEALWGWSGKQVPRGANSGTAAQKHNLDELIPSSTWIWVRLH